MNWPKKILSHEKTIEKLKEVWDNYIKNIVTKENLIKFINEKITQINESQRLNFIRWDILNTKVLLNPVLRGSFEAEVDYLKEFIQKRFDILNDVVKNATFESITAEVERKSHHGHHKRDKKSNKNEEFKNFLLQNEE